MIRQQQQQSVNDVEDKLRIGVGCEAKIRQEEDKFGVTKKANGGTLKVNFITLPQKYSVGPEKIFG